MAMTLWQGNSLVPSLEGVTVIPSISLRSSGVRSRHLFFCLIILLRSTRIIVQFRLCGFSIGGKKCLEEREGMNALPFGGLYQAGDDAVGL